MEANDKNDRLAEMFDSGGGDPIRYLKDYGRYLSELLEGLDYEAVARVIQRFDKARHDNSTIFFIGNGGSAATASHFSQDLGEVGRKTGTRCFRTLSLTDNVSYITAMGNDYGYDKIFTCQLENLFREGDVLVAISASGNSANVVEAVKMARRMGGSTVALVGFDGGGLKGLCDHVLHVVTNKGEYGPVEDVHMVLDHMISTFLALANMKC